MGAMKAAYLRKRYFKEAVRRCPKSKAKPQMTIHTTHYWSQRTTCPTLDQKVDFFIDYSEKNVVINSFVRV